MPPRYPTMDTTHRIVNHFLCLRPGPDPSAAQHLVLLNATHFRQLAVLNRMAQARNLGSTVWMHECNLTERSRGRGEFESTARLQRGGKVLPPHIPRCRVGRDLHTWDPPRAVLISSFSGRDLCKVTPAILQR